MVIKKWYDEGLQKDLALEAFAATSIDNIDRTAPGKRITSEDHSRGFYGTSVQHVSPMPFSCELSKNELPAVPCSITARSGIFTSQFRDASSVPTPRTLSEGVKKASATERHGKNITDIAIPNLNAQEAVLSQEQQDLCRLRWYRPPQTTKSVGYKIHLDNVW